MSHGRANTAGLEAFMSRQLDKVIEDRNIRRHESIVKAVEFALEGGVAHAGGELRGFSYKNNGGDGLLTLRAAFPAGKQVAFVGGEDLGSCLIKAVRAANGDALRWRADKWGT